MVGIVINSCSILLGGVMGTILGNLMSTELKNELNLVFGLCSLGMGINSLVLMENMPAVVFSIILGTILGILIHLEDKINGVAKGMQSIIGRLFNNKNTVLSNEEYLNQLVTIIVLFCASGTGIYGSLVAGMSGDTSILISKSILDFFTAAIFACNLGYVVSFITVPQFIIFSVLFMFSKVIFPLTTATMINDFKACGGFLMVATGFRMMKLKNFSIANMLPSMIFVMPFSYIWVMCILPLLG